MAQSTAGLPITDGISDRIYAYIGGIVRAEKGVLLAVGGVEDHVHLYIRWRTDESIANRMRTAKSQSSKWVHDASPALAGFAWREGYSAFTFSKAQEGAVKGLRPAA